MKLKFYIITYDNQKMLDRCLDSIIQTESFVNYKNNIDINIINNHSNFNTKYFNSNLINIIHNSVRPDFSTGHLARNWNQAIINGFKNLDNPDCDLLLLIQNDVVFTKNFILEILKLKETNYNYITFGCGDELQIIKPDCIKTLGLFDERFCNIGYQEADYFFRAMFYNSNKSSINDYRHKRIHNPIENKIIENVVNGGARGEESHIKSLCFHKYSKNIWYKKWNHEPENWEKRFFENSISPIYCKSKQYMFYPYFESTFINYWDKFYEEYS